MRLRVAVSILCAVFVTAAGTTIDPTGIPSGDGKLSTNTAATGYVLSCTSTFNGGGASAAGPWINVNGTWNSTTKLAVQGSVAWPAAAYSVNVAGATRTISTNDLPNHNTGTFPIAVTDPAYAYDRNPGSIAQNALTYSVPRMPTVNASPTCLGLGPIGVMLTGAALFNGLDAQGHDAVEHESQDSCHGHPARSLYHYHDVTTCIADPGNGHSTLLGYARDGFGIYGNRGETGAALTDTDLDVCHGHTHALLWDGIMVTIYHYHATKEYPYTLGCYRGTPH
jgi:YHYH protein